MKEERIFHEALRRPADHRAAFLNEACGEDEVLRKSVEVLLRAHANPGSFLETPATAASPILATSIAHEPGARIGPYKLLQQIGVGGMGVVYMAEQVEPIEALTADQEIRLESEMHLAVEENFEANLAQMAEAAQKRGVPILFCTPVSNRADCAPLTPLHRESFPKIVPLKEAAEAAAVLGNPRLTVDDLLAEVNEHRDPTSYLSTGWDVADPYNRKLKDYRRAVAEIDDLVQVVVGRLVW